MGRWLGPLSAHGAELDAGITDITKSLSGIFHETALHERTTRCGERAPVGLGPHHRTDDVADRIAVKGFLTAQCLIEAAAECPHVRALVDRLATCLLRAHVGRRAHDDAESRSFG